MALLGIISLSTIWFKLHLKPRSSNREIPFLTVHQDDLQQPTRIELKYSPNINHQIQDVLVLILKDYFFWHGDLTNRLDFIATIESLIIKAIQDIVIRWSKIDVVDFINNKLLVIYLTHLRAMQRTRQHLDGDKPRQYTHSKEFELMFASKYADVATIHKGIQLSKATVDPSYVRHLLNNVLQFVLPVNEYQSLPFKTIVVEITTTFIVIPILVKIANPQFINSFIDMFCTHLLREMRMVKELRRALESNSLSSNKLKTYDEFLQMINNCNNLLDAKRIRDQIVMEIRRKRLVIGNKSPQHTVNGVKVKKLIQYTNKLVIAKRKIEQRIISLGGSVPIYQMKASDPSLLDVLKNSVGLSYFSEYLDQHQSNQVLQLYLALEGLNHQLDSFDEDMDDYNQLMIDFTNILNIYFSAAITNITFPTSIDALLRVVVDQLRINKIDFVSFAKSRSLLFKMMEQEYFNKFKSSDLWLRMSNEFHEDTATINDANSDLESMDESELLGTDAVTTVKDQLQHIVDADTLPEYSELTPVSINPLSNDQNNNLPTSATSTELQSITLQIQDISDTMDKLKQHEAILTTLIKSHEAPPTSINPILNRTSAKALLNESSPRIGTTHGHPLSKSKSTFVLKALGSEDEPFKILIKSLQHVQNEQLQLQQDKLQLENQTRDLSIKPGLVDIYIDSWTKSSLIIGQGVPDYILYLVRVKTRSGSWNIYRRYSEFLELYDALKIEFPLLPYELPKKRPNILYVGQLKDELHSSRQQGLEQYLKHLLLHEDVCLSEPFRKFLSQDVDNTRVVSTPQLISHSVVSSSSDLQDTSPKKSIVSFIQKFGSSKTSPIKEVPEVNSDQPEGYKVISELILELFDLQESIFRKHAVSVVLNQIFGGLIEKKLYDSVERLLSEEMIVFYLITLKERVFTEYDEKEQQQSGDDKETRIKLELLFPELFGGFLGRNNAYKAAGRVFESFQNELLNMNLTTTILVEIIKELFPEVDKVL